MKNKQFALLCFSLLASLFLFGIASAITLAPNTYSANVAQGNSVSFTFTINNDNDLPLLGSNIVTLNSAISDLSTSTSTILKGNITLSALPTLPITIGTDSSPITVTVNVPPNQAIGTYLGTITISGNYANTTTFSKTISLSITVPQVNQPSGVASCKLTGNPTAFGTDGISVSIDNIKVTGFGDDQTLYLYDNVTLSVRVENNGNDTMKNIKAEWAIYDINKNKILDSGKSSKFNIKESNDKTVDFQFTIDELSKIRDNSGDNYKIFVWANAEDSGRNNLQICDSNSQDIAIADDDFVILNNIVVPDTVPCGSQFEVISDVTNIGSTDEQNVVVGLYNKDLGINQKFNIGDINGYDNAKLDALINIPSNAEEKTYFLTATIYNDNGDVFQNNNNNDATFPISVSVSGSCLVNANTDVSAALQSGSKAGDNFVVKVSLKNTGTKTMTFTLNPTGYTDWATSATLDQSSVALKAGETKDVLVTLATKNTVSTGAKTFNMDVLVGNQVVLEQPITVQLAKAGFSLSGTDANTTLIMGLVILILVIIVIIVSIRVSRK